MPSKYSSPTNLNALLRGSTDATVDAIMAAAYQMSVQHHGVKRIVRRPVTMASEKASAARTKTKSAGTTVYRPTVRLKGCITGREHTSKSVSTSLSFSTGTVENS